ncbi:hypothetical protein AAHC03_022909 [Spirometra sp. Aus1]
MPKGRQTKAERTKLPRGLLPSVESGEAIDNDYLICLFACNKRALTAVQTVIDDILDDVAEEIYQRHLKRQQIPFSVKLAAQAILEIVECNFLTIQSLESGEEEDEELNPIPIHPWAQGMIPKEFVPHTKSSSPEDVKENEILTGIERTQKSATSTKKKRQEKTKHNNCPVESAGIRKTPIQEKEFIPGWSKRPPGFHYVPRTGAVPNRVTMQEADSERKTKRSRSTEKPAEQIPLRALNILKNNLSKSAVFDAEGNILATLPLAPGNTGTSSRVRLGPLEKTGPQGSTCPSRSTSRAGSHVLWRIGQKQEVRLNDSKLLDTRTTQQTGRRKSELPLPLSMHTDDRSQPKPNMNTISEAIRLAPGVSLWDGTNLFTNRPQAHSEGQSC